MNTNMNDMPLDDSRFDRLVDSELSDEERRELLAGLDSEPGGWRRCALAFLESQCWKQAFGPIVREGLRDSAPVKTTLPTHSHWPSRIGALLAMAASFLVALWLGSLALPTRSGTVPDQFAQRNVGPQMPVLTDASDRRLANVMPRSQVSNQPWHMVTVSAPGGGGSPLNVPAIERDNIDPQWLQSLPPAMPDEVRQAFSRTGHEIEQHRELVPVPLQDGRRMIVPVDHVDVHYVGNGTY